MSDAKMAAIFEELARTGKVTVGTLSLDVTQSRWLADHDAALVAAVWEQFEEVLKSSDPDDPEYLVSPKIFINMLLARIRALPLPVSRLHVLERWLEAGDAEAIRTVLKRRASLIAAAVREQCAQAAESDDEAHRSVHIAQRIRALSLPDNIAEPHALTKHDKRLELPAREAMWLTHGHQGLYGDDGEMQCGVCGFDFKREPLVRVVEVFTRALQQTRERIQLEARRQAIIAGWHKGYQEGIMDGAPYPSENDIAELKAALEKAK